MSLKKETVETRLDNIEEILKMLLVSSVLGSSDVDKIQENIISQFRETLAGLGIYNARMNYIENIYPIELSMKIYNYSKEQSTMLLPLNLLPKYSALYTNTLLNLV